MQVRIHGNPICTLIVFLMEVIWGMEMSTMKLMILTQLIFTTTMQNRVRDNDQNKDSNTDSSNFSESKETATDSTAEETDQNQRLNNDERNKNENSDGNNEKKLETGKNAKHHKQRVKVVGDLLIVNKGSDQSVHNKVHEFNDVQQDVSRVTPLSTKLDLMDPDDNTKNSKPDRNNETRPSLNQSEPHRRPSSGDSLNFMFEDGGDVVKVSSVKSNAVKAIT